MPKMKHNVTIFDINVHLLVVHLSDGESRAHRRGSVAYQYLAYSKRLSVERADESCRPRAPHGPRKKEPVSDEAERWVVRRKVCHRESIRGKPEKHLSDGRGRWGQAANQEGEAGALELAEATQHLFKHFPRGDT